MEPFHPQDSSDSAEHETGHLHHRAADHRHHRHLLFHTLVGNYLLQKTDTQLINQAQLIFNSMDSLSSDTGDDGRSLMNTYYVEVRDSEYKSTGAGSVPMLRDGVVSEPSLPADGSIDGVTLGQPFTTRAVVHITTSRTPDHSIMQAAQSPWRVVDTDRASQGQWRRVHRPVVERSDRHGQHIDAILRDGGHRGGADRRDTRHHSGAKHARALEAD